MRELIGTQDEIYSGEYVVPYFDVAPRMKSIYPKRAVFRAKIEKIDGDEAVLFDGGTFSGDYKLFWNGEEIPAGEIVPHRVYDAKKQNFQTRVERRNQHIGNIVRRRRRIRRRER